MQKKPPKTPVHRAPPPQQVRIIGGAWKRTLLPVVSAEGLRPTPDRVRETVFNWINHLWKADWSRATVVDLFAGSGALGFEAASRGAEAVTMVDTHTPALRQLEAVKAKLGADNVSLLRADAFAAAVTLAQRGVRADLIFLDPPFHQNFLSKVLPLCIPLLAEGGLVYVEAGAPLPFAPEDGSAVPDWLAPWEPVRADKAGAVFYHLLTLRAAAS